MCMCFQTVCVLESSTSFFLGTAPPLSAPQCPDPVTVPLCVFLLSSAVHRFGLIDPPPPSSFLCLFRIHYQDFFPVFSPRFTSHSSSKFLGSALFQSHISKNKLITPPTHEITLGKRKAKRKHEKENGEGFTRIFFFSPLY